MWLYLARLIAFSLLAVSLIGWLPRIWWCGLFVHFLPLYTLALLLVLPLLWRSRDRWARVVGVAALAWNLSCLVPLWGRPAPGPPTGRVLLSNVLTSNPEPGRVLSYLQEARADVVVLLEISPQWMAFLQPLLEQYPGQLVHPRSDNFGIVLLSRQPLSQARVLGSELPWLCADTRLAGKTVRVVAAHPPPPISARASELRNRITAEVADQLQGTFVLLGDFNDTPWAPSVAPLRARGRLARTGLLPSWPTMLPALVRIPIDQCWLGGDLEMVDCQLGPGVGSDHLPLLVDLK